ncbi:MAG: AAA family ATPase [Treponema sp.]|jgi:exonuclease SbcC|nr:AAA family ATPase [Treponema sp.]
MRPVRLIMENFGPFAGKAELDFSKLEDIFLVTGKTGSGKTTIFDALCFALYGEVPGSRSAYAARLKSDHTGEDAECMVSLEFSLGKNQGGRTYTVERRPRQEIKRKRGGGVTVKDETVILWENSNGKKSVLGNKKGEVNQRLLSLIGLEAREFFKIVLLPQGEFAEFLRQNTNERQKVLGKLFPIEEARRVKELAAKKALEADAGLEEALRALELLRERAGEELYEEAHERARQVFEGAREKLKTLGETEIYLAGLLSLRQREADSLELLNRAQGEGRRIAEEESGIVEKGIRLDRSRNARPLGEFLRSRKEALKAREESAAALLRAGEDRTGAEKILGEAESREKEAGQRERELIGLRERRPALLELREEEAELQKELRDLGETKIRSLELARQQDKLREDLAGEKENIEGAENLAAEGPALETLLDEKRGRFEFYKKLRGLAERKEALERERKSSLDLIDSLEKEEQDRESRIPLMADELRFLKEEQGREERADMAAFLARNLAEGEACPVCGSMEHPRPAPARDRQFGLEERIKGMEKTLGDLEKLQAGAKAELQAKKAERARIAEELRRLEQEAALAGKEGGMSNAEFPAPSPDSPALPGTAEIDKTISGLAGELNGLLSKQSKLREAARDIQKFYQRRTAIQDSLNETGRLLAAALEREKYLEAQAAAKTERRRKFFAALPETVYPAKTGGKGNAAEILAALDRAMADLVQFLARQREEREEAGRSLARAQAAEQGALQNRDQARTRLREVEALLERELAASPFASFREAEESLLDQDGERELEKDIREWGEEKARIESSITLHQKNLEEIRARLGTLKLPEELSGPLPGLGETEKLMDSLKSRREQAEEERDRAFARLRDLERDKDELEAARRRYEDQSSRAGEWRALADDLAGKNPQKQPFDSWLLGSYLAEIAGYATSRLEKMSEYRYSLLLDSQRQPGQRGYAGLDLTVFDAHTGKNRPCATLSGGESFLASISLALGLADSIQARSGGLKLDAVFIDEGFGSLDEETLDKAMLILDELRDHRMVGLISHVGEMRSRIPCRVEVVKTAVGSKILNAR